MGWPVKVGGPLEPQAPPSWKYWLVLGILLVGAGAALAIWLWPHGRPVDVRFWLYAVVTPLLIYITLLGLRISHHEQSVAASIANEEATAQTQSEWQIWAQRTLNVLAHASVTPEAEFAAAVIAMPPIATVSPHKGRKFCGWPDDGKTDALQWAFEQLIRLLDGVLPDWLKRVHSIHVQGDFGAGRIEAAWCDALALMEHSSRLPVTRFDPADFDGMFDEPDAKPRLFVAVQTWPASREPQHFSELAVALLLTADKGTRKDETPMVSISRPMHTSAEELDADLSMLFKYTQTHRASVKRVWCSGVPANFSGLLDLSEPSSGESPGFASYMIDHYLGPAYVAQRWLSLAVATEALGSDGPQLVASHTDSGLVLHLISGRQADHLFSA